MDGEVSSSILSRLTRNSCCTALDNIRSPERVALYMIIKSADDLYWKLLKVKGRLDLIFRELNDR